MDTPWPSTYPEQAMAGRRTILNDAIHEAIIENLEAGVPVRHACEAVGIHETTHAGWVAKGNAEIQRVAALREEGVEAQVDPAKASYVKFAEATTRARAHHVETRIQRLNRMAEGGIVVARTETTRTTRDGETLTEVSEKYAQPNANVEMFMLERHPDTRPDFGRHDKVELSGPDGGPIAISVKDELTALIEASARRLMGEPQELVEVQAIEAPPE